MTIKLLLLVITCTTISALSQMAMKLGMSVPSIQVTLSNGFGVAVIWAVIQSPLVIGGLGAYVLGAGLWLFVLSKADLSLVYPFLGLGFIMTMLFGWLFLNENVGATRILGTLIIAVGSYMVARS